MAANIIRVLIVMLYRKILNLLGSPEVKIIFIIFMNEIFSTC